MRGLLPSRRKVLEHETQPDSLINVDVRIACNKIKNFIHDLVHSDQIAYANDDYIGESIRFVDNVLEHTECNETMHICSNSIILWHSIGRRAGLAVLRFDWSRATLKLLLRQENVYDSFQYCYMFVNFKPSR